MIRHRRSDRTCKWCRRQTTRTTVVAAAAFVVLGASASALPWPGRPTMPPPVVQGAAGPPPAWVESRTRSLWLAYSSFCWRTTCADYVHPLSRADLPQLRLPPGALIRVHFAFRPREVHAITFVGKTGKGVALKPARITTWRPRQRGVVSFDVRGPGGSASYVVRLRFQRA
jgi:hypothetical protein